MLYLALLFLLLQPPAKETEEIQARLAEGERLLKQGQANAAETLASELVKKYPNSPKSYDCRWLLTRTLVYRPEPKWDKALEVVGPVLGDGSFKERAEAFRLQGQIHRFQALATTTAATADTNFQKAWQAFSTARDLFEQRQDTELTASMLCERAEMELQLKRFSDAENSTAVFLKSEPISKTRSRQRGLYLNGTAAYFANNPKNASRALNLGAPYEGTPFGWNAEYMLGRVLHRNGETNEAATHYELAISEHLAAVSSKPRQSTPHDPFETQRHSLLSAKLPEAVLGSHYHLGMLAIEKGRTTQAIDRWKKLEKDLADSPWATDFALAQGYALNELGDHDGAAKLLTPLTKQAKHIDQVLHELGRMRLGIYKKTQSKESLKQAIEQFRKATEQIVNIPGREEETRLRRWAYQFDLGDAYWQNGQLAEAAQIFETLWNEQALPKKREEILHRMCLGWAQAGQADRAWQRCEEFKRMYPNSPYRGLVQEQVLEILLSRGYAQEKDRNNPAAAKAKWEEVLPSLKEIAEKPADASAGLAGHWACAIAYERLNRLPEAIESLRSIPAKARHGDYAQVGYHVARLQHRASQPGSPDHATHLEEAIRELKTYLELPNAREDLDALELMVSCVSALAPLSPKTKEYAPLAEAALQHLLAKYDNTLAAGRAIIARAEMHSLTGEKDKALGELRQFLPAGSRASHIAAPLALVKLSLQYRIQRQPGEARRILEDGITRLSSGSGMQSASERKEWLGLMKYHAAAALAEDGQNDKAIKEWNDLILSMPNTPIAMESAIGVGLARYAEASRLFREGEAILAKHGPNSSKRQPGQQMIDRARNMLNDGSNQLTSQADQMGQLHPTHPSRAAIYYVAMWMALLYLDDEIDRNRDQQLRDNFQRMLNELNRGQVITGSPAAFELPDMPRQKVRVEHSQNTIQNLANRILENFGETPIYWQTLSDLADQHAYRSDHEAIIKLLEAKLTGIAHPELVEPELLRRLHFRLAHAMIATGRNREAQAHLQPANTPVGKLAASELTRQHLIAKNPTAALELLKLASSWPANVEEKRRFQKLQFEAYRQTLQYDSARIVLKDIVDSSASKLALGTLDQMQNRLLDAESNLRDVPHSTASPNSFEQAQLRLGLNQLCLGHAHEAAATFLYLRSLTAPGSVMQWATTIEAARAMASVGDVSRARFLLEEMQHTTAMTPWAIAVSERLASLPWPAKP
ncbi:MAG: tetratricopeptide repeat protein [Fimbriiglobus sp.]